MPSTTIVPNMPTTATITIAAARPIRVASVPTIGAAMTAVVVAAPSSTNTCVARLTNTTASSVDDEEPHEGETPRGQHDGVVSAAMRDTLTRDR